jgi:hypothetical protein
MSNGLSGVTRRLLLALRGNRPQVEVGAAVGVLFQLVTGAERQEGLTGCEKGRVFRLIQGLSNVN